MATIIDFAQARKALEARRGWDRVTAEGPPEGRVILFTGVRYERFGANSVDSPVEVDAVPEKKGRRKKKS